MSEKEEKVWVVKEELGGEKAWTMSKVKSRKKLGKRLIAIGLPCWLSAPLGFYCQPIAIGVIPAVVLPIAGLLLYHGAKNAEDIGKARLQDRG